MKVRMEERLKGSLEGLECELVEGLKEVCERTISWGLEGCENEREGLVEDEGKRESG